MKIDESVVIRSVILLSRFDCRDEAEIIVLEFYGLFAAKVPDVQSGASGGGVE